MITLDERITLEAVDAKIDRARGEMRSLKSDIAAFCEERARLILREADGECEHWVYRGGSPKAPIGWSVRAGEFAYNLRSALDHLVWQLVIANNGCPERHNEFPIHSKKDTQRIKKSLKGVAQTAMEYIISVQPYQPGSADVGNGLALLNDMCNIDKHRHLVVANVRWTGSYPKSVNTDDMCPMPKLDEKLYLNTDRSDVCTVMQNFLELGKPLVVLTEGICPQSLEFPIDAYFASLGNTGDRLVSDVLNACIGSVEMVVSRLRSEVLSPTAA